MVDRSVRIQQIRDDLRGLHRRIAVEILDIDSDSELLKLYDEIRSLEFAAAGIAETINERVSTLQRRGG